MALDIVKHFTDNNQVKETLEKINKGKITKKDIIIFDHIKITRHISPYTSGNTVFKPSTTTVEQISKPPTSVKKDEKNKCSIM